MKSILLVATLLTLSSNSFAASICMFRVPGASVYPATLVCDGKKILETENKDDMDPKATLIIKKYLDQGYRIVSEIGNGDSYQILLTK